MNGISELYSYAVLALGSYTTLQPGIPNAIARQDAGRGMSELQSRVFAERLAVITQYNDTPAEGGREPACRRRYSRTRRAI